MRIGIVCPYSFDVPGGVQHHVRDLAESADRAGPRRSACWPRPTTTCRCRRTWCRPGGPCRCATTARWPGCPSARCRRPGCGAGSPPGTSTSLHVHEPLTPSLSMLAVLSAKDEPVVATFHTAMTRSRAMHAASGRAAAGAGADHRPDRGQRAGPQGAGGAPRRRTPWEIPNGVAVARFADAEPLPGWPGAGRRASGFLGRFTEPRKGFARAAGGVRRGSRRTGPGCGCWSPGLATTTSCWPACPRSVASTGSPSSAWSPSRTRRGCCAASTCTWRRTPAASRSA